MKNLSLADLAQKASWLVTGLASLSIGLKAVGFDMLSYIPLGSLEVVLCYVVGIAGVASLIVFAQSCSSCCGSGCKCK